MKHLGVLLIVIIVASSVLLPVYLLYASQGLTSNEPLFFGVTYGQNTVEGAEQLIDKVQNYTTSSSSTLCQ